MNRSVNSSLQLTLGAIWRHTVSAGSDPVSAVATRLSPIRWTASSMHGVFRAYAYLFWRALDSARTARPGRFDKNPRSFADGVCVFHSLILQMYVLSIAIATVPAHPVRDAVLILGYLPVYIAHRLLFLRGDRFLRLADEFSFLRPEPAFGGEVVFWGFYGGAGLMLAISLVLVSP